MKADKVLKGIVLIVTVIMLVAKLCGWADISWLKVFSVAIVYAVFYALGALYLLWWYRPSAVERRKEKELKKLQESVKQELLKRK